MNATRQILALVILLVFIYHDALCIKYFINDDIELPIELAHIKHHIRETDDNGPQKVHIALGATNTQMVVSYVHNDAIYRRTYVRYDTKSCQNVPNCTYAHQVDGTYSLHTYYVQAGIFADVLLSNLVPDTTYYYVVGNEQEWTAEASFKTAPLPGPQKSVFAVYGDMGILYSNHTIDLLNKMVQSGELNAVLHVGDISYADDRMPNQYEQVWNIFFDKIESISKEVPYMVCPGNHEYPYNYTVYNERFRMPGLQQGDLYTGTNMYYSFDYANIHFVAISTEPSYENSRNGTPQFRWLEEDLSKAAVRKSKGQIDWIIVFGHKPMYCSYNWSNCCGPCHQQSYSPGWDKGSFAYGLRESIEDLLHLYSVDMYVAGHVHSYERMFPVYNEDVEGGDTSVYLNPKYPVHIVSGAAGCMEIVPTPQDKMNWQPPASVIRLSQFGFGKMTVYGSTALQWQFIGSNSTYIGDVLDEFWIKRTN